MDKSALESRLTMINDAIAQTAAQHNALCGRKAEVEELLASINIEIEENEDAIKER